MSSQSTLRGGEERERVDYLNQAAQLFNKKLADDLSSLDNKVVNKKSRRKTGKCSKKKNVPLVEDEGDEEATEQNEMVKPIDAVV
ncbi:hypothetical protein CQW23_34912 [Capsicum baccatum]|uniref:Uncharacterized protein n=1 Tax=Capsicum baccatum TaxID=33114 RepID=A0A2G2UXI7_CAPBA|nr:hypothetical protein CQW23_34912 [Capsicum baccatum]